MKKFLTIFFGILVAPLLSPRNNTVLYENDANTHVLVVTVFVKGAKCLFWSEDLEEGGCYPELKEALGCNPDVDLEYKGYIRFKGCSLEQILQFMQLQDRTSCFTIKFNKADLPNKPKIPDMDFINFQPYPNSSCSLFERLEEFIKTTRMEFNEMDLLGKYVEEDEMGNRLFALFNTLMKGQASVYNLSFSNYPKKELLAEVQFCADTGILDMRLHNSSGVEFCVSVETLHDFDLLVESMELLGPDYSMRNRFDAQVLEVSAENILKYLDLSTYLTIGNQVRLTGVRSNKRVGPAGFIEKLFSCSGRICNILRDTKPLSVKRREIDRFCGSKLGGRKFKTEILPEPEFTS